MAMKKFLIFVFLLSVFSVTAQAKELSGKDAAGYIGSLKEQLTGSPYSLILLKRRDRDMKTFAELDGIVFALSRDKYHYIRRQDDDHRLILSAVRGEQAPAANSEESAKYEALIKENKLYPHVILDKDGKELFLIYSAIKQRITWSRNQQADILLEVRDPFKEEEPIFLFDQTPLGQGSLP
jgi:hypothetical protein